MKTSCIIPTRDRCDLVQDAIESVFRQCSPCAEVIVVDDGSVDGTGAVIAAKYPEVTLVRLNGAGPGAARNAGVRAATGDIVMFLDSDDRWCENHVQALSRVVIAEGFPVAYGICETTDEIRGGTFRIPGAGENVQGDCRQALMRWCFLVPSAVAVKREVFLAVGGFSENADWRFGEDWDFFLRLSAGYRFGFAGSEPITKRRLHRGSLCNAINKEMIASLVERIRRTAIAMRGCDDAVIEHLDEMTRLIREKGDQWQTVQDWYAAMKSGKMP